MLFCETEMTDATDERSGLNASASPERSMLIVVDGAPRCLLNPRGAMAENHLKNQEKKTT